MGMRFGGEVRFSFGQLIAAHLIAAVLFSSGAALADPSVDGEWGPIIPWTHVPVSAANLPDGRIVTWASNQENAFPGGQPEYTHAGTWNPYTDEYIDIPHPSHDMFCSHLAMLEDGRVFINGGRNQSNSPWTSIFDMHTNSWVPLEEMNRGRWYPTSVALPDGGVITFVGTGGGNYPDLYTPGAGWNQLTGIDLNVPILNYPDNQWGERNWWPLLAVRPDGTILHAGPTPQMHVIDPTGNGSITPVGDPVSHNWYSKHGTTVYYNENLLLTAGGWQNGTTLASTNKAMIIDITNVTPAIDSTIDPMIKSRKFHNSVMLPTGEVLIVGGNNNGIKFNDDAPEKTVEYWNPVTKTWRLGAAQLEARTYHSVALLMTDGRVFSAGGGLCGNCSENHQNAEIYTPYYLFDSNGDPAIRPEITSAPDKFQGGQIINVNATANMQKFSIIKMSATTHAVNTDLRYLEMPFTETAPGQ